MNVVTKRRALTAFGILAIAYVVACIVGRIVAPYFVYPAPHDDPGARELAAAPNAKLLTLTAKDGLTTRALDLAPRDHDAPYIVLFHGNGGTIGGGFESRVATELNAEGYGVLLVEYRGYGISRGTSAPNEAGLYLDAEAALDDLNARGVPSDRVVLMGISLGTAIASEMALRHRGALLILVAPFTSMIDMAHKIVPLLPSHLIMPEHYETRSKAPRIAIPVLIIHGKDDGLVPFAMGRALLDAFPNATMLPIDHGHHNDLFVIAHSILFSAIDVFIRDHFPRP